MTTMAAPTAQAAVVTPSVRKAERQNWCVAAVEPSRYEGSFGDALTAENDAGIRDAQTALNFMAPGEQKQGSAQAVGAWCQTGNVINRRLNALSAVTLCRRHDHANGCVGNGAFV